MNVSDSTKNALYEMISQCFQMNRWLDRWVSVLGVNFACNNSSNLIHQNVAHYFPQLSDKIGEKCLERYNITVEYGATDEGKQSYTSVEDMIQQMEDKIINFQNMFIGCLKLSFNNGDLQVYTDLSDLLKGYNEIVEQVILLNDKIKAYDSNVMAFDHDIETFWKLGE